MFNITKDTNGKIVKGSLADIAQSTGKSLAETFLNAEIVVIVDTSSSMSTPDAPSGKTRYQAACEQLAHIQAKHPGKVAVISFSDYAKLCPNGEPEMLSGSTNMADALRFVKPVDNTGTKIVLVSDGEPNSESETLDVAKTFKTAIDVIYIGPEFDHRYMRSGWDFLRRLADATGGKHFQSSAPGLLGEGVETLLLAG